MLNYSRVFVLLCAHIDYVLTYTYISMQLIDY